MSARQEILTALCALLLGFPGVGCAPGSETRDDAARDEESLPPEVTSARTPEEVLERILALGGGRPGTLPVEAWERAEQATLSFLPPLEGTLQGASWRVTYTDLPRADYLAVDLMEGTEAAADRRAWFHVVYLPEPIPGEPYDAEPLQGFPTAGEPGRYLRLRAGEIDLLAVPESPELRSEDALRDLVGRFDLKALAALTPQEHAR